MRQLSLKEQIQEITRWALTREIALNDPYLNVYDDLRQGAQSLLPLSRQNLLLMAHAVFGWMPTQLRVNLDQIEEALAIVVPALDFGDELSENDISFLGNTFQGQRGNSVVAASKILHFLSPERFPITDRWVAGRWGLKPNGQEAAADYQFLIKTTRQIVGDRDGREVCDDFRRRLVERGYNHTMSDMRILELISFLPPR